MSVKYYELFTNLGNASLANLIISFLTLILLVVFYQIKKRFRPKSIFLNSGPLIAILIGVIVNSIIDLE